MKSILVLVVLAASLQASASEVLWSPSVTRDFMASLDKNGQYGEIKNVLEPEVVEALEWYSIQDDAIIIGNTTQANMAAATAAAAVGGAVAKVVEKVWDKYVGNGLEDLTHFKDDFSLSFDISKTPLVYPIDPALIIYDSERPRLVLEKDGKVAILPAAATAAAGAAGYKAAEYVLNKFGNSEQDLIRISPEYFDMNTMDTLSFGGF